MADGELLTAELIIEYPFSRTTGPVIGAFFTALREGFIVGIKAADGRVLVPPFEYDPITSEALTEVVEVGDVGEVVSWAWVNDPLEGQPLDRPFAFALIKLDGADTPFLHAVDTAGDEAAVSTGLRVEAQWADEREGHIKDIECFVPEGASA
jgi:uncharacterized OB-fold protein